MSLATEQVHVFFKIWAVSGLPGAFNSICYLGVATILKLVTIKIAGLTNDLIALK